MCGISGLMFKKGNANIGSELFEMLRMMVHRGKDSTGIAVYEENEILRLSINCFREKDVETARNIVEKFAEVRDKRLRKTRAGSYLLWFDVDMDDDSKIPEAYLAIDRNPSLCIHSFGRKLRILKDMGSAEDIMNHYRDVEFSGYQGIGHVRLATESVENINFAHPFTTYLMPELAIVHNGQLTNYFNMRRKLERRGVVFKTFNDSEIIAHYIGYHMTRDGWSFEEALERSIEDFDGVFTYAASTPEKIGIVRDRLGIKPVYVHEDDEMILFGTEQVCFSPLAPEAYSEEMDPGRVMVWQR